MAAPVNLSTTSITATSARFNWEAGAAAWTPAEITTALWLDAADSDTITLNDGNVSQWDDKSGNDRHVTQGSSTAQPAYGASTQNGIDVLTFDGNDWLVATGWTSVNTSQNHSYIAVARHTNTADIGFLLCQSGTTGGTNNMESTLAYFSSGAFGSSQNSYKFGSRPFGNNHFVEVPYSSGNHVMFGGHSGGAHYLYFDGDEYLRESSGPRNNTVADLQIGRRISESNFPWQGDVCEIIILDNFPNTDTRQKIEGYLAWKWGLQANLPSGHPYKDAAP